ncbi:hypothetical protein AMTR_s00038p00168930 [Amborella trichopoda]|uniref:BHLH domain-containing protein n=1 Tax=Amborella trichopoda TaxID=13333 RepID=U5D2P1_AMBTC|nr:hypothetical protein AMTR_s00038p00168930 [Amborella trichopoda]
MLLFSQGKRSICDQLYEATNYITHQKEKIQELRETGDRLRSAATVEVRTCGDGIEVRDREEIEVREIEEKLRHLFQHS